MLLGAIWWLPEEEWHPALGRIRACYYGSMKEVDPPARGSPQPGPPTRTSFTWFGDLWCWLFHRRVMLPIHGYYECRSCFRRFPVSLDTEPRQERPPSPRGR